MFPYSNQDLMRIGIQNSTLLVDEYRRKLLAACDWTQLPDVTIPTKAEWATYRQALRDISKQEGFPFDVIWPTPPQE